MLDGTGRGERRQAIAPYVTGLSLDGDLKGIEPMAARGPQGEPGATIWGSAAELLAAPRSPADDSW